MTPDSDDRLIVARARARNSCRWVAALRGSDPRLSVHAALRLAEAPIEGVSDEIWRREAPHVVADELGLDLEGRDGKVLLGRLHAEHADLIGRVVAAGPDRPLSPQDERMAWRIAGQGEAGERPLTDIAGELLDVPADCAPALYSHPIVLRAQDLVGQHSAEPQHAVGAHLVYS